MRIESAGIRTALIVVLLACAAAAPSNPPPVILPIDSVWRGTNNLEAYATRPAEHRPMSMRITKREENKFAAHCTIVHPDGVNSVYQVEGLIENDKIAWKTTKIIKGEGEGPPPCEGTIKDDAIEVKFDGSSRKGHTRRGTIQLQRKREKK